MNFYLQLNYTIIWPIKEKLVFCNKLTGLVENFGSLYLRVRKGVLNIFSRGSKSKPLPLQKDARSELDGQGGNAKAFGRATTTQDYISTTARREMSKAIGKAFEPYTVGYFEARLASSLPTKLPLYQF